jgi:hypothetical protein
MLVGMVPAGMITRLSQPGSGFLILLLVRKSERVIIPVVLYSTTVIPRWCFFLDPWMEYSRLSDGLLKIWVRHGNLEP